MKTYVVGHKNPDTDSIVSAIALAQLEGFEPVKAGKINKETEYVLDLCHLEEPGDLPKGEKKIILVDHNETAQMSENVNQEEILAIYDHHKLSGLCTREPITVWIEPVGSTATLISDLYNLRKKSPDQKTATLLIAAIISDTINLASPTTCDRDTKAIETLNKIAKINLDELVKNMFAVKSDISDISTKELLSRDYKVFEMNGKKVGIGVWETVNPKSILERKDDIITLLGQKKKEENLDRIYFAAVDIAKNESHIFIQGDEEKKIAEVVWGGQTKDQILYRPLIVSRKKQMVPPLEKYFAKN